MPTCVLFINSWMKHLMILPYAYGQDLILWMKRKQLQEKQFRLINLPFYYVGAIPVILKTIALT